MLAVNTVSLLWTTMCMGALLIIDDDDSSNLSAFFPWVGNKQSSLLEMLKYDQMILFHL